MPEGANHGVDFKIYHLAVEMADRISARRATANSFYLALHSALVGGLLVALSEREPDLSLRGVLLACSPIPGLLLAVLWRAALTSYKKLNEAKYAVITHMEKGLPASTRPYTEEWEKLQAHSGWRRDTTRRGLTWVEMQVPLVFVFTYAGIAVAIGINAVA